MSLQGIIPEALFSFIRKTEDEKGEKAEELRLRAGQEALIRFSDQYIPLKEIRITPELLKEITMRASRYSLYTVEQSLRYGWIPLTGGGRLGVAATVTTNGIREISSLCLRLAREYSCISDTEYHSLYPNGFENTLVLSPPGYGKTTLLRSLIKKVSDSGTNVGVADDRFEIAACRCGLPSFSVGSRTDVISGGKRSETVLMLLRSMAPQVIACDEIITSEDVDSIRSVYNSGVQLLASIHASNRKELETRPIFKTLSESHVFKTYITIEIENGKRRYRTETV